MAIEHRHSLKSERNTSSARLEPWSIIHLLLDNAAILIISGLLGLGLATLYIKHRPAAYVSEAVLEVGESPLASVEPSGRGPSDLDSAALLKTIEQTLVSQAVLREVLADPPAGASKPANPPPPDATANEAWRLARLRERIDAQLVRGTRLIVLSARAGDPEEARALAQRVLDVFFTLKATERREQADRARGLLLAEARRLESEVRAAEERLQAYRETNNAASLLERHDVVHRRLADLGDQATAARARRISLEADRAQVERLLASGPLKLLDIREIALRAEIVELRKELNQHTAEVSTLARRYREKHPTMMRAANQLGELQASLEDALRNAGNAYLQAYESARANELALDEELRSQEEVALELSRLAIPYRALEREARSFDALHQQILTRLKANDLPLDLVASQGPGGSRIHVVGQPLAPDTSDGPSAKALLALGLVAGLGLGLGFVVIRRAFDTSLDSVDEVEAWLGLPSLAVVPRDGARDQKDEPVVQSRPATLVAEAFRSLRTSVSLLVPDSVGEVVLFTSALQGEGKSYCSLNYAAAVAQQGRRTLLIDADVRRSWLRARFATEPGDGGQDLSACLLAPSSLDSLARPTSVPGLFVLGNFQGSTSAAELLTGANFRRLLEHARSSGFTHVVVDTAPVTAVSDTLCIAPHATHVCLVVRAGHTPRRLVRRACLLLGRAPTGLVLNQTRRGRGANYRYYSTGERYFHETRANSAAT